MKKILIVGNVGKNPELLRDKENNSEFAVFNVGINTKIKGQKATDWVSVSCSKGLAKIAVDYLHKGSKVLIEGLPVATAYINKEGKAVASLKIYAQTLEILNRVEQNRDDQEHELNSDEVPF